MINKEKEDYMRYCAASEKQLISEFVTFFKELIEYSNAKHTKSEILAHFKGSIVLKIKELEKGQ